MNENDHPYDCHCSICKARASGLSPQEALDWHRKWADDMMQKHGWYVHFVAPDDGPTGANYHTHGLQESFEHPDLQIVLNIPEKVAHNLFHNAVDRIKAGEKFQAGQRAGQICGGGYEVKFVEAHEGDRTVLRMILPDVDHHLDDTEEMVPDFRKQYADLREHAPRST